MDQPFTLADVVTNSQLARRSSRVPDYQAEIEAMNMLAETLAHCPQSLLQKLVEVAQELCRADSAGISLLEEHGGEQVFRWEALAGVLRDHVNGTMPRNASPCGITIDRDVHTTHVFAGAFFPALKIEPPIVEALLVPFHVENQPVGTVWVVTHTDDRKFDQEDERIIKTLANFAAAGWQLWKARRTAEDIATSTKHDLVDSVAKRKPSCKSSYSIEKHRHARCGHSSRLQQPSPCYSELRHDHGIQSWKRKRTGSKILR